MQAIHGFRETERLQWGGACERVLERLRAAAFPEGSPLLGPVHVLDLNKAGFIKAHVDSVKVCCFTLTLCSALLLLWHVKVWSLCVCVSSVLWKHHRWSVSSVWQRHASGPWREHSRPGASAFKASFSLYTKVWSDLKSFLLLSLSHPFLSWIYRKQFNKNTNTEISCFKHTDKLPGPLCWRWKSTC